MVKLRLRTGAWVAVLGLMTWASTLPALAGVIAFDGEANTIHISPINSLGFLIGNPDGQEQHFHEIDSAQFGLPSNGTGILLNDRDTQIFVMAASASFFTLGSVDVASALGSGPAVGLTVTGFLNNIVTNTITIASLGSGYTTVSGASLGNVDKLIFDGTGGSGGFVLDNLSVNDTPQDNVPEPGTIGMAAAAALIGLVSLARRKRAAA